MRLRVWFAGVLVCRSDPVGRCPAWYRAAVHPDGLCRTACDMKTGLCRSGQDASQEWSWQRCPGACVYPELLQPSAPGKAAAGACFLLRHPHGSSWAQAVSCRHAGSVHPNAGAPDLQTLTKRLPLCRGMLGGETSIQDPGLGMSAYAGPWSSTNPGDYGASLRSSVAQQTSPR